MSKNKDGSSTRNVHDFVIVAILSSTREVLSQLWLHSVLNLLSGVEWLGKAATLGYVYLYRLHLWSNKSTTWWIIFSWKLRHASQHLLVVLYHFVWSPWTRRLDGSLVLRRCKLSRRKDNDVEIREDCSVAEVLVVRRVKATPDGGNSRRGSLQSRRTSIAGSLCLGQEVHFGQWFAVKMYYRSGHPTNWVEVSW